MNLRKSIFVFLALIAGAGVSVFADGQNSWELRAEAKVDSSGIFLDQVISAVPSAIIPHVRIASAPAFGRTNEFPRARILEMARKVLPELNGSNCLGAASIRISRRSRMLNSLELTKLLTAELQKNYVKDKGELELSLTRPWNSVPVPDEPFALKVTDIPASGVSPNFVARFELWNNKEHIGNWQVAIQCHVWRDIPIAHSTLSRGESLAGADIILERRDLLLQRDVFMDYPTTDPSLELTETLRPGMPVLNRSVRVRPAIRRGRVVDGIYKDGALSISLKVEAMEDGLPGQTVRVRNPKTKRELYGKVENETTVLISL
ncbi:MAG TPA: flagellar basal body P-ring formation chaperone FlgA [Verrucomicrobiae bacterium]|nr:flagellar basal body P-ring formation chaperone FlgA [Verrucomicrobiae bacterium]